MLISDFTESLDRILQLISIYGYMPQISLFEEETEEEDPQTASVMSDTYNIYEGDTAEASVSIYNYLCKAESGRAAVYDHASYTGCGISVYGVSDIGISGQTVSNEAYNTAVALCGNMSQYSASAEAFKAIIGAEYGYVPAAEGAVYITNNELSSAEYGMYMHEAPYTGYLSLANYGSLTYRAYREDHAAQDRYSAISSYFCDNFIYDADSRILNEAGIGTYDGSYGIYPYELCAYPVYESYSRSQNFGDNVCGIYLSEGYKTAVCGYADSNEYIYGDISADGYTCTDSVYDMQQRYLYHTDVLNDTGCGEYAAGSAADVLKVFTDGKKTGDININVDFKAYAEVKNDYDVNRFADIFAERLESELRSCAEGIHY